MLDEAGQGQGRPSWAPVPPGPSRCLERLSEKEPPTPSCALWGCTGLGVWQLASRVLDLRPQALGCQVLDSGSKQSPLPPLCTAAQSGWPLA